MPVHNKARSQTGRLQHHHRTDSGGSSKVGLNNISLTQKDSSQPLKRLGHSAVDLHQARGASQFPKPAHLTSTSRTRSKDHIAASQRRAHSVKGKQQQPQRPNFSIAHSDEATDSDDEWVSSESGATTPHTNATVDEKDEDGDDHGATTPVGRQRVEDVSPPENEMNGGNNDFGIADRAANGADDVTTPRVEVDLDLARPEAAWPDTVTPGSVGSTSLQGEMNPPPAVRVQAQSTPATPVPTSPPAPIVEQPLKIAPVVRQVHSEAPSPTQLRQKAASKRTTLRRQMSSHGEARRDMPPHPLIRGQSNHEAALRPARLAPITVNSEAAQVQLTASPSTPSRSGSPSYFSSTLKQSPPDTLDRQGRLPSRKGSISSLHSIATLPAPSSSRYIGARGKQDRIRTLSTISNSSSSAALTALNAIPSQSRPSSPPVVVRFPSDGRRDPHEGFHNLLPPQYLATHMTGVAKYNPLYDSFERVMRAKHGR